MPVIVILIILLAILGLIIGMLTSLLESMMGFLVIVAFVLLFDHLYKKRKPTKPINGSTAVFANGQPPRNEQELLDYQLRIKNAAKLKIESQSKILPKVMANPIYIGVDHDDDGHTMRIVMMDKRHEVIYQTDHLDTVSRRYMRKVLQACTVLISYDTQVVLKWLHHIGLHYSGYYVDISEDFSRYQGKWDAYFNDFKNASWIEAEAFYGLDHSNDLVISTEHLITITSDLIDHDEMMIHQERPI